MKQLFSLGIALLLISCGTSPAFQNTQVSDSTSEIHPKIDSDSVKSDLEEEYNDDYNYADYYIVIADTGFDYFKLRKKMLSLSRTLTLEIDTMDRHYNIEKNLIALPDDDGDEIYAGEYYPRRHPSPCVSLEYLNFYQDAAREKTIALVCGIYESENTADSALQVLAKQSSSSFKIKSKVYIGCMH